MATGTAGDVEPFGLVPLGGIEIGRAKHAQDLRALFNVDIGDRGRNACRAAEGMQRGCQAYRLFKAGSAP